ncbi:MAG: RNA-processing protein [Candidatus Aenigmarchaeota archaeon]|nr:RNA-processing protein [Candidatus Aenigmarchaeota archaeon]
MLETVKIPERRKGVLIGRGGSVKKALEENTNTKIRINDSVEIEGEALDVMKAREIIKAIGRGFSPEKAFKLLNDEYQLFIISLEKPTKKRKRRILSRIIGSKGMSKNKIEMFTNTDISIYGKTISIIGKWEDVEKAAKAIDMLIGGKPHSYVFKYLEGLKGETA